MKPARTTITVLLATLALFITATGCGDEGDTNQYTCSSCPDTPFTATACDQFGEDAQCESATFELKTDNACLVGGSPAEHSTCVLVNCAVDPACL